MLQQNSGMLLSLIQQFRKLNWELALPHMSQAEYLILSTVRNGQLEHPGQKGIYVSVLAEHLMTSVSMVSKLLKALEEKEWILRTIDVNSRRNTFVSLTPQGKEALGKADQQMDKINSAVAEKLGEETRQQLVDNISTLLSCYEEVLGHL